MTTLNVNEGASSSAGSHNELSSLLPTNSEPIINPTEEQEPILLPRHVRRLRAPSIWVEQPTGVHGRVAVRTSSSTNNSRLRHRPVR